MEISIPKSGITAGRLIAQYPAASESEILDAIKKLIDSGEAHQRGDLIMPGKPRPGRPPAADGEKRVSVTIRLPAELVDWLRGQPGYTKIIENLLRVEAAKSRRLQAFNRVDP